MSIKQQSLEEALLKKIENNEGHAYQILILAQEYGATQGRIDRILRKYIKNNKITIQGFKFVIKDQTKLKEK